MQKLRRVIASLSMVAILSTLVVSTTAMAGLYYDDVPTNEWYAQYVDELAAGGYLGTTGGNFNPATDLTRADALSWLVGLAGLEGDVSSSSYTDVPASHPAHDAIEIGTQHGVVNGYGDGTFGPNDPITREQYAKMAVEAFDLPLTEDCSMFTDSSSIADWACEYVATAYSWSVLDGYPNGSFGPGANINRAEGAKITVNSASPVLRETDEPPVDGPDEPPVTVSGDLEVSVSSSTPAETFVPMNGFEVPYTVFRFSAEDSDEAVKVTQVVVTRSGLGSTTNFSNVRLYLGSKQLGGDKTFSSASNTATFNLSSSPLIIPAGSVAEVVVTGDMAGTSSNNISGARNILGIAAASHVTANATVGGNFPAYGEVMQLSNSLVGTLTVTHTDVTGSLDVGDTDEVLGRVRLQAGSQENVLVSMLRYKQTGSATGSEDLSNLKLWHGGTLIAENPEWDGDFAVFDFSDKPLSIEKGDDVNLTLRGDVVGGIANTVGFEIKETKDVVAWGEVLGFRVNVSESAAFTPTARSIVGGVLNFALAADNPPSQDVADGGDNIEFMRFNIVSGGDAVRIEDFGLVLTTATGLPSEVDNITIYKVKEDGTLGSAVAGPIDASGSTAGSVNVAFTEDWEVTAQMTETYAVIADLSTSVEADDTFTFAIDMDSLTAEYVSNGDSLTSSDYTPSADSSTTSGEVGGSSTMTVKAPTLTLAIASSPQSQTIVKNARDVKMVGFTLSANTVSDLTVTSLAVTQDAANSGSDDYTDVTNLRLYEDTKGVLTKLTSGKDLTSNSSPKATFSSLSYQVKAGDTVKVVVLGDIPSTATAGNIFGLGIAATTDVSVQDADGRTASVSGTPNSDGETIYVTIAGSGTLTLAADGDTPSSMVMSTNSDKVLASIFQFSAKDEDFKVSKFRLSSNGTDEIKSMTVEYQNKAGETVTKTQPMNTSGQADFSGESLWVPKNKDADLKVYVNTASEAEGADSGATVDVDFVYNANFEAFGNGSNTRSTSVGSANVTGNNHVIYASDLLVKIASDTPKSADVTPGSGQEVLKVNLKAVGENTPAVMAMAFTVSGTATLDDQTATGSATLVDNTGDNSATEAYVTDVADEAGTTTTIEVAEDGGLDGIPMGATVIIHDDGGAFSDTAVKVTNIATDVVTFTPAVGAATATSDTINYVPLQPGTGKLYFGGASTLTADVTDNSSTTISLTSTNGFANGDTVYVRGATTSTGVVIECSGTVASLTSTVLTLDAAAQCYTDASHSTDATSGVVLDFNYDSLATAVAYVAGANNFINEEITGEEYFIVKGDLTGANPSTAGSSKTVQVRLNAGTDITWNDDWSDLGDDLDNADENTSFIIQQANLNKEKEGYNNFPLNGSSLKFES